MASTILGAGASGILAAQAALATTSHNIANVNTPGFSRQETVQANRFPLYSGEGFIGQGVSVTTVRRVYSEFLDVQARSSASNAAHAASLRDQMGAIDRLLGDPSAGLAPALNAYFQGAQDLAAHPGDGTARQIFLGRANSLASRFHDLDTRLSETRSGLNTQVAASVAGINAISRQLANLNTQIVEQSSIGNGSQTPNDLLDQRDALLRSLGEEVGFSTALQSDGALNVVLGNGQAIVVGFRSQDLVTVTSPESPGEQSVALSTGAGAQIFRDRDLGGGRLGGTLEFRSRDLVEARNALGRIAMTIASDSNDVHRLGMDRYGQLGADLFSTGAPAAIARTTNAGNAQLAASVASLGALTTSSYRLAYDGANWQATRLSDNTVFAAGPLPQTIDGVAITLASGAAAAGDSFRIEPTAAGAGGFAVLIQDGSRVAAAAPIRTGSSASNSGTGRISAGAVNGPPPADPDLQQPVTITFTGAGTFDVSGTGTGNPTGLAYTPGMTLSFNGWSVTLDGAPATGDAFTISANTGNGADNRGALRLAALQTAKTLVGGTATYSDAYGQMTSAVGNRTREAQISADAHARLAAEAAETRQSMSGVNLDEEAAKLLRYQQAYQAAGKALSIADQLFATILELGR